MLFIRRILSLGFFLTALGCLGAFVTVFAVRNLGTPGEVSQVFRLDKAMALGGGRYLGFYNVAITPKGEIAQICDLLAVTPGRYVNLLDHQVWIWPVEDPLFAYEDNPQSRILMWSALAVGFALVFLSYFLWRKRD